MLIALVIVFVSVLANSGLGLTNAEFVLAAKRGSPLTALLRTVACLLGGVFYPVTVLLLG